MAEKQTPDVQVEIWIPADPGPELDAPPVEGELVQDLAERLERLRRWRRGEMPRERVH